MKNILKICILVLFFFSFAFSKELNMQSKDGYLLKAWLIFPKQKLKKYPLAIIAHQFGSNHRKWIKFAQMLRRKGFVTLNIDLRGHGLSIYQYKKINKIIMYTSMDNLKNSLYKSAKKVGFKYISQDISMWINYIEKKYSREINNEKIGFFGASLGAGALISLMFDYQPKIAIFFSPGNVKESGGEDTIADVTTKVMLISSQHDFALQRTLYYASKANYPTVLILSGSGHGEVLMGRAQKYINIFLAK